MMEKQTCRYCLSPKVKNGKSVAGFQRHRCKSCKKTFQAEYRYLACGPNISRWISSLMVEGSSVSSISRLLKIPVCTVIRKTKAIAKLVVRPFPIVQGKEYEVDDMRTYIGNKQRLYWVVYALRRDTKEVIDFKVGKRNTKTLQRVLSTVQLSEAKKVYTDKFRLYKNLIPNEMHSTSAYQINHIERKNLSIRTHLKRLSRKTICFSKSREMLEACLKIYFWSRERKSLSLVNA
jgi:IS1 family transposase/transposase-like protein